ncbi:MAG: aminomethyl-transferring glycine dehydrogenase subunit GcvPB [Caldiserica bacterium]|nr:aminomethyl-transferring glycine dehydrogenase subunit GcvPB [Caldisericota bacterium]MDH7562106.1 aminomethyl-transferring glycine dehydrogenase subunit GcvPB [Caldisericota bacterium]
MSKLIFEKSKKGKSGFSLPEMDVPMIQHGFETRGEMGLPEVSEPEVVRHFTLLSQKNYSVDTGFYPLGSCTMKYNPKVNEDLARKEEFSLLHPEQPDGTIQGALELLHNLEGFLCQITGMSRFTFQPAAGAHGELTGLLLIKAYMEDRGEKRDLVLVPDSAHGTNPASAALTGCQVVEVKSDLQGGVDLEDLKSKLSPRVMALMLTNPNTLGLFDENIVEVARMVHDAGGLLYYDGANLNGICGYVRPGDTGFDVVHLNLHKTFSAPHGGGGPGAGPVGVKEALVPFLPVPTVDIDSRGNFFLNWDRPKSIGMVRSFLGNFLVALKAYAYILTMGGEGLKKMTQDAVLNANYLLGLLKGHYQLPFDRICKHEFVLSTAPLNKYNLKVTDVAKRLLDLGFHAPTIAFPLIVEGALMIEPTETETRETLEEFARALIQIEDEARTNPELLREAPHNTPVRRIDEVGANRNPVLRFKK